MDKHAVILLSGGLDSTTVLAIAKDQGVKLHAISFSYGQNHSHEIDQARVIAKAFSVESHTVIELGLAAFGESALTADIPVPKHGNVDEIGQDIPVTYVPARNTIFLSYALALAEVKRANAIYIGVNALDYSGYPDCRPEYIVAFEKMANYATKAGVTGSPIQVIAPLQHLTKAEIIAQGIELGVDYSMTTSCYDPNQQNHACGGCDACLLRLRGFAENGIKDPTRYQ